MSLCDDLSHRHPNASEALAYAQSRRPCGMSRCHARDARSCDAAEACSASAHGTAFVRGATWRQEVANDSWTPTAQSTLNAVQAFLDEHRRVLAHAGDDCSEYHAIYSALTTATATPEQTRGFLLAEETQRRLNTSGAGVSRWGQLVLELEAFCQQRAYPLRVPISGGKPMKSVRTVTVDHLREAIDALAEAIEGREDVDVEMQDADQAAINKLIIKGYKRVRKHLSDIKRLLERDRAVLVPQAIEPK